MNGYRFVACQRGRMSTLCCAFFCFLFQAALAGDAAVIGNNRGALNAAFGAVAEGNSVTLAPGQRIDFSNSDNAIVINKNNITLKGGASIGFGEKIGSLSSRIGASSGTLAAAEFQVMINNWQAGITPSYATLSAIVGGGSDRTHSQATNDINKWLTTTYGTANSTANGLSLQYLRFGDVNAVYSGGRYVNGIIGNDNDVSGLTRMDGITGNVFNKINVTLRGTSGSETDYLAGGGVVGVRSTAGSAEIRSVTGNIFDGINILTTDNLGTPAAPKFSNPTKSAYLEGGGLVGVNGVSSPDNVVGHASLDLLENNFFTNINIGSNDILLGGGLVGVNNNSKNANPAQTYAKLGTARGNIFGSDADGNIKVMLEDSLRGGGVIGINGLSSAAAQLDSLENNAFAGVTVATGSYIKGGGIVGLQTNDGVAEKPGLADTAPTAATASLGRASGNLFLNQKVTAESYIEGGGIIGLRSNKGAAELGTLSGNVFRGIDVMSGEAETISGGGVIGLSAVTTAHIGDPDGLAAGMGIRNNVFDDIKVDIGRWNDYGDNKQFLGNYLNGGGIIGVHARDSSKVTPNEATIDAVDGNRFTNSSVTAMSLSGGGIVGVNAGGLRDKNDLVAGLAAIGKVTNNVFDDLRITTINGGDGTGYFEGGGVIGAWNKQSATDTELGVVAIDEVDNNSFTRVRVNAGLHLQGGGIIGMRGSALMQMGKLTRNIFTDNVVETDGYLDGGGIIGVTSPDGLAPYAGIKLIADSIFSRNTVSANNDVLGGIVYTYGLTNVDPDTDPDGIGMTIRNSQFMNNTLKSTNGTVYGAVAVDTGAAPLNTGGDNTTLTLTATSGNSTVFRGNSITDTTSSDVTLQNADRSRTNSLYFGTITAPSTGNPDPAVWDPTLNVNPLAGGVVALYDPIRVNQDNDRTFTMNVLDGGDFIWGGNNVLDVDAGGTDGAVMLKSGSATTILDGESTTTFVNGGQIADSLGYRMSLNAPNFTFKLENGGTLNVEGHNRFNLSGVHDDSDAAVANLNGTLHFNLHNTEVYKQGDLPSNHAGDPDYQPLLTIKVPDNDERKVNLADSAVSLGDFKDSTRTLMPGDRFYLIEVDNARNDPNAENAFTGDPVNSTDTVRHGNLTTYTFDIDKNLDNLTNEENTRFLVARLRSVAPGSGVPPISTARVPGITILQRSSDWLTGIPFYDFPSPCDPCNPCNPCDPCAAGVTEDWVWTSFAEVKGSWFRANAHESGHADIRGTLALAGVAAQKRMHNGSIHFGAFFDAGASNYSTYNHVMEANAPRTIRGEGDLENVGGGIAFRRNWDNGLRLDLMARAGGNRNRFTSNDLTDVLSGAPTSFTLRSAYAGATIGLDYGWKFRQSDLNVYGRYSWLMEEGGTTTFSSDETVDFDAVHSHRGIVGGRWTWNWNPNVSSYVGAAYEHEFDGKVRITDRTTQHNLAYDGVNLGGGTGVGEIGATYRHSEKFNVTAGVEGYVGKREGIGAFLSAVWRW